MAISDEAESPGQPPLEPTIKHTSENDPSPKKGGSTISNSERPLEIPMATIDGEHEVQGAIGIPQRKGPLGMVEGAETKVITSGSSTSGVPMQITPIFTSADDHLPHEPLTNSIVPTHEYAPSHQPSPLVKAASALESHGTRLSFTLSSFSSLIEEIHLQVNTHEHTVLAEEHTQLLRDIRGLPNFHKFLQPRHNSTDLFYSLPSDGPVIVINVAESRCDALACRYGIERPLHIALKNFSCVEAEKLRDRLQSDLLKQREAEDGDRASRRAGTAPPSMAFILKELWHKVVQPVFEAIGYSPDSCPDPSDRHRIWWCPTGPLTFLPLHAAGIYDSDYRAGQRVSDFVVSSYTPTITSLNQKFNTSSTFSKSPSLLLISQPNTPGLSPIPSTRKETHDIKTLMDESDVDVLLLEDAEATTEKVKTEMTSHNWVHFACHGVQDADQPLKSGVHLHDGRLELLEILQQQIPNPDLAFLSACQTSKGDFKLSDEVMHLVTGMLNAGYRGVVGTMWSISDMHGPEFATEFYKYLLTEKGSGGLDSTRAAYALDHAVRKVRESLEDGDAALLTWVPYVHFGY